jgi:DNA-directed RNA polymerase specialized sigma24 family protein
MLPYNGSPSAKMEGYTVEEIAVQLGWRPRTVRRRMQLVRQTWRQELQP